MRESAARQLAPPCSTHQHQQPQVAYPTSSNQVPVPGPVQQVIDSASTRVPLGLNAAATTQQQQLLLQAHFNRQTSTSSMDMEDSNGSSDEVFERVINIKNCPLCHKPRINSRAEMDIVTHLAVCASQDWGRVDRIVVGNFVTASQAQRKWYTRIISKISSGDYRLGAVGLPHTSIRWILLDIPTELSEYNRTKSHDRSTRRRENASVCSFGYKTAIQGCEESYGRC